MNEPIADAVRSILDGHIVLSRHLAHAGHYPAIDVLASVSRLVGEVTSRDVRGAGDDVRRLMAAYKEKEDLIAIGAYQPGTDPADRRGDRGAQPDRGLPAPARRRPVARPPTPSAALLELVRLAELARAPDPLAAGGAAAAGRRRRRGPGHAAARGDPAAEPVAVAARRRRSRAPRPCRLVPGYAIVNLLEIEDSVPAGSKAWRAGSAASSSARGPRA